MIVQIPFMITWRTFDKYTRSFRTKVCGAGSTLKRYRVNVLCLNGSTLRSGAGVVSKCVALLRHSNTTYLTFMLIWLENLKISCTST